MASPAVYDAIRAYLEANWTGCDLVFENEGFQAGDQTAPWVYVEVIGTSWDQHSIGAGAIRDNRWEEFGIVMFHVFVETGTGTGVIRSNAYGLADLFRGLELLTGTLIFQRFSLGAGEPGSEDGRWWRTTATVEWERKAAA